MINTSSPSEMSRQSSERQTEASTPFPQDVANQVNLVKVIMSNHDGDNGGEVDGDHDDYDDGDGDNDNCQPITHQ